MRLGAHTLWLVRRNKAISLISVNVDASMRNSLMRVRMERGVYVDERKYRAKVIAMVDEMSS